MSKLLAYIYLEICAIFFIDFSIRFKKAKDKREFMKWGRIDLLSSTPVIDFLRAGRILRLIRLLRIVRALASAAITSILLLLFSSKVILQAVQEPGSNIKTAEEAIW